MTVMRYGLRGYCNSMRTGKMTAIRKPKLIHNEKQYRTWAKASGFEYCLSIFSKDAEDYGMTRAELKREQDEWYAANAPAQYPCVGMSVLVSYQEQTSAPAYLYRSDLERFLRSMAGR